MITNKDSMEIRLRYGLSKYKWARILGVSWNTINSWEKGRHKVNKVHRADIMKFIMMNKFVESQKDVL